MEAQVYNSDGRERLPYFTRCYNIIILHLFHKQLLSISKVSLFRSILQEDMMM